MNASVIQDTYEISRGFFHPANQGRITDELSMCEAIDALADLYRDVRVWILENSEETEALKRRFEQVEPADLLLIQRRHSQELEELRKDIGDLKRSLHDMDGDGELSE